AMASAPIICSTTVPGTRRSMRNTSRVSPRSVRAIEYSRTRRYRVIRIRGGAAALLPPAPPPHLCGPTPGGRAARPPPGPPHRINHLAVVSRLVEPDVLEAVEEGGRVLLEALDRGLGEVDPVRGEEPEVGHVLEDQDLHAVIDLLALLLVHRLPALLEG